jgi:thiol:disulfide interchange protein DsbD
MNVLRARLLLFSFALVALISVSAAAQIAVVGDGGPGPVKAQHLTAEMVTLAPSISPGGTLQAGLVLTLEEPWHVYWINAGDSGQPPKVEWTLPEGITAGPMQFTAPSRLPLGPLMDFGYEDLAPFPILLRAAPSVKTGPIHLDAKVSWLVCREVCIPGKAHLGLNLTVAPNGPPPIDRGALGTALTLLPKPLPASAKMSVLGGANDFVITLLTDQKASDVEFYPYDPDQIQNAADQTFEPIHGGFHLRVKRSPDLTALPAQMHGLLKLNDKLSYEFTVPVVPGEMEPTAAAPKGSGSAATLTWVSAIGLALVGGIILNLMPCVFPVLFLKGLALVQSTGEERSRMRRHGLVYTLGILVSFWIIVAILLVLRAGGSQAGWGFQLQSPVFIAILASFLFLFALSLAGQFDIGLSLTSTGGELAKKEGYAGSFFTGVLATIVATPCTAPLMGAAVGFALAQPPAVTFAVFTALGLGLAIPYLLLTLEPSWTRLLPRPGAWMETLKQLTSVPLFATVIWLVWVYGRLFSADSGQATDHIARLLLGLLVLAIAGWTLGRWPAKAGSAIAATLLCLAAIAIPLTEPKADTLTWQPYSQQALDTARAAGHPVFIDFTAAWCLSCQVNEKAVLRSGDVEHQLSTRNVTLLRADWTHEDPEITKQLASLGRSGVPTYVLYPGGAKSTPDVLPELLTKSLVLDAIQRAAK